MTSVYSNNVFRTLPGSCPGTIPGRKKPWRQSAPWSKRWRGKSEKRKKPLRKRFRTMHRSTNRRFIGNFSVPDRLLFDKIGMPNYNYVLKSLDRQHFIARRNFLS